MKTPFENGHSHPRIRRGARRAAGLLGAALMAVALCAAPGTATASGAFITPKYPAAAPAGARGICQKYGWACERSAGKALDEASILRLAKTLNRKINRSVRPVSDERQYRRAEFWTLPTTRGGDCEDFVLLKKKTLAEAGIPSDRLLMATVLDRDLNNHAILILRTARGDLVLDNLTDRIVPWEKTGYTFLRMQNPERLDRWDAIFAGGLIGGRS